MILNGGNFGGLDLEGFSDKVRIKKVSENRWVVEDENNELWVYDSSRHEKTETADFIGMLPDVLKQETKTIKAK